jgi:tetratricopeptide (TPR) repeat protein
MMDMGDLNRKLRQAAAALAAGDHAAVERLGREILERSPLDARALAWVGIALAVQGRHAESVAYFRRAASVEPGNPGAHLNLGNALQEIGELREATGAFRQALALNSGYPEALNSLGVALAQQGGGDEAMACYRKALELRPEYAEAHSNLGQALLARGEESEALACFRRAAMLQPDNADFHHDLGTALAERNAWDEAVTHYERALALNPGFADSQYSLAVLRMFRQEFEPAWRGYEARFQCEGIRSSMRKSGATVGLYERLPRWRGPGEAGVRDVAVWAEQGLGDQVLLSTLIPALIEARTPFAYEVDRRLLGAYERAFPGIHFAPGGDPPHEALQRASRVLMAGSLPGLFRPSRADFARQPLKLWSALPDRVAYYRHRLDEHSPGLKVALSWRSSRKDHVGPRKSAPLGEFSELLRLLGVGFVDVQYGDTAGERRMVEETTGARFLRFEEVDYFNDLEELLAILEACDLVISTSNVTAHFAGALGKRTWLLYPADRPPFHYWAHDGSYRCLWYPSVEIVTARELADWKSLLEHVGDRLRRLTGGR